MSVPLIEWKIQRESIDTKDKPTCVLVEFADNYLLHPKKLRRRRMQFPKFLDVNQPNFQISEPKKM